MKTRLYRLSDKLASTSKLLKNSGLYTWKLADEWTTATIESNTQNYQRTISDLENVSTDDAQLRYLDRYEQLLILNWETAAKFASLICWAFDEPDPNREALQVAESNMLHGRRNQPRWLVSSTYSVLKHTSGYLTSARVIQGYKLAKATGKTNEFDTLITLMFDYSTQLTEFVYDIIKNKSPVMSICEEPYCKDHTDQLRRGRCPACYAWVRRWQDKHPEQMAPPVPKEIIERRSEIRANSPKKKMR